MATFKVQIEDVVGSVGDDGALTQFLTDGAKEIINVLPRELKLECSSLTNLYIGNTDIVMDLDASGETFNVTRENADSGYHAPCRKISAAYGGMATDSGNMMYYASETDPVYWTGSDSGGDPKLFVIPTPTANQPAKIYHVKFPAVAYGDSAIVNFPDEAEYLVVLYASVKGLQRLMNDMNSNSDITTAFTATNAEIDETLTIADNMHTEIALINSSVDSALTEIGLANAEVDKMAAESGLDNAELDKATAELAEAVTLVDSNIDTATAAIATAAGRINTAVGLANAEFDKCDTMLALGETDTEGAINTALAAMVTELGEAEDVCDLINGEVDKAFAEVALAKTEAAELATQTDNSGDIATALTAINTALDKFRVDAGDPALFGDESQYLTGVGLTHIKDALEIARDTIDTGFTTDEDSGSGDDATPKSAGYWLNDEDTEMVDATIKVARTEISRAEAHLSEWIAISNTLVAEADGFAKEVQSRVAFSGAKSQAVQAYIATANGYVQTAQAYATELQSKINISNGYGQEVQMRLAQAQSKREESNSRIAVGNAYLTEASASSKEAETYAAEVNARIAQVQGQINVAQGYIANGAGYSRVADGYAKAAQGFISTANSYLQSAQGYLASTQGYGSEIQSKLAIAASYSQEAIARMQEDNQKYQWYQGQQIKLQQDYDKGLQMLIAGGIPVQNTKKQSE